MIAFITGILGLIPGVSSAIQYVVGKVYDSKVAIMAAQIGGDTAVANGIVAAAAKEYASNVDRLQVIAGSKVLLLIILGFALPWIVYEWKVVVWDTVLQWGVTAPVKGLVGDWGGTIITCLFGSGTALSVGHMYFNRRE